MKREKHYKKTQDIHKWQSELESWMKYTTKINLNTINKLSVRFLRKFKELIMLARNIKL